MRGTVRRSFLALTFVSAALSVCGCGGPNEPCPGVVEGATYEVEIHESTLKDSPAECHLGWGLDAGFTLLATVNETGDGGTCLAGRPDLSAGEDWTFEKQKGEPLSDRLFESSYEAQFRACESYISFSVSSSTGLPCFIDHKASSAECELRLELEPRGGSGCPVRCSTSLAVTVKRI